MSGAIAVLLICILGILFAVLTFFVWRRVHPVVLKVVVGLLTTVMTFVLLLVSVVGLKGIGTLYIPHGAVAPQVTASVPPDQLAAAQRHALLCASCHSPNQQLPLSGGNENFLAGLGALYAPNLTPSGPTRTWTDGDLMRRFGTAWIGTAAHSSSCRPKHSTI